MGEIQVRTPQGIVETVRIAGDTPTEEEKQAIIASFMGGTEVSETVTTETETEVSPTVPKTEIDYESGVGSSRLRYHYSRGNNPREKRLQLLSLGIPEEGFFQDDQGEFILDLEKIPEDIKESFDLKSVGGKTKLAIDEEGLSWSDIIDLGGEAGTPILFGTAAAFATTGVGIPVAALIVGGASAAGYVADEAVEYAEGVRDQTLGEDAMNLFFEFALGGGGELGGRLVAKGLGRLIKGPGTAEANTTRETARAILAGEVDPATGQRVSGRPTLRATNMAPLLGRAQAFFEGVFPNSRIATQNADYLHSAYLKFLRDAGIPEGQAEKTSTEFLDSLKRDIERMYSSPEKLVEKANNRLRNTVQTEIDSLIRNFGDTSFVGGEAARRGIEISKRIFDEDVDLLYSVADDLLDGAAVIPTQTIKGELNSIVTRNIVQGKEIQDSALGRAIQGLDRFETAGNINSIRTALREAAWDPTLIGTQDKNLLRNLLTKVDDSLQESEIALLARNQQVSSNILPVGTAAGPGIKGVISRAEVARIQGQKAGLEALRSANDFYKNGISRFDTLFAQRLIASSRSGGELVDPDAILDEVILPNRGKLLQDLLNSTRPSPMKGLGGRPGFPAATPKESYLDIVPNIKVKTPVEGPFGGKIVNLREVVAANPDDSLALFYRKRFNAQKAFADEVAAAREAGVSYRGAVRDSLARRWLERTINAPGTMNMFGRVDPLKVVQNIRELGSTGKVLFGKQYDPIMRSLSELALLGDDVGERELRMLAGRPISEQLETLSALTGQLEELKGLPFLRSLETAARSGEVDKVVSLVTRNKDTIRQAKEFLGADSQLMNDVKDEVLAKAIGSLGDDASVVVSQGRRGRPQRKLSPEFIQEVMSGRKHDQIMKAIDSMGKDKMESLFGKEFLDQMTNLARKAEAVSMRPIAGLGGLETASLARSLTMGAIFVTPIQILGTMLGLRTMGSLVRSRSYLNLISRPTGNAQYARNLEKALTLAWGTVGRTTPQFVGERAEEVETQARRRLSDFEDVKKRVLTGTTQKGTPQGEGVLTGRPPYPVPEYTAPVPAPALTASGVERERVMRQLMGLSP